jgi:hypothetical protein
MCLLPFFQEVITFPVMKIHKRLAEEKGERQEP